MSTPETPETPDMASSTPEPGETIRAKWLLDGAVTLADAAERLEAFAAYLRNAHEAGWTLTEPIADDYGFLVSPDGDAGPMGLDDEDEGADLADDPAGRLN